MRRPPGTGTIERKRGRFMARLPTADREPLGICDTYEEAAGLLDGWLANVADGSVRVASGLSLRGFGAEWLDRREIDGYRGIDTDRGRWRTHIEVAHFVDWPMRSITRADVIDWLDGMKAKRAGGRGERRKLSRSTIQNTLNLLRCCLAAALERHIVHENIADGVRLRMKSTATEEPWTYLTAAEQAELLSCQAIDPAERLLLQFAIGTGLREGELWNLELRDLHVDGPEPRAVVRFGSKGKPPKNGRIRTVPLFGYGLDAARRWLDVLPGYTRTAKRDFGNPDRLVFPTARGCRRQQGKPPGGQYIDEDGRTAYRFHDWIEAAGIERPVRFHDLRHTCASALVSGMWGRMWSLEEVRDLLGHQSVTTTERYGHLAPSVLQAAAAATPPRSHHPKAPGAAAAAKPRNHRAPPRRLERPTNGLGTFGGSASAADDSPSRWRDGGAVAERLGAALAALAAGEAFALRALIEAAEEAAVLLGAGECVPRVRHSPALGRGSLNR